MVVVGGGGWGGGRERGLTLQESKQAIKFSPMYKMVENQPSVCGLKFSVNFLLLYKGDNCCNFFKVSLALEACEKQTLQLL